MTDDALLIGTNTEGIVMNATAAHIQADQIATRLRDARCCDAFAPCSVCRTRRAEIAARRRLFTRTK